MASEYDIRQAMKAYNLPRKRAVKSVNMMERLIARHHAKKK